MFKKISLAAVALATLGSNGAFAAGPSTVAISNASMGVTLTVASSCSASSVTTAAFGSISVVSGATATGSFKITCDPGTDYAVGLGAGNNFASSTRQMKQTFPNTAFVPYGLYTDTAHSIPVADVASGQNVGGAPAFGTFGATAAAGGESYNVYAKIPTLGTKPIPGDYSDSVAINIIY